MADRAGSAEVFRRKPGLIWRKMNREAVIFDPDTYETFLLNPAAAVIWELCDGTHCLEDIVDATADRFETRKVRSEILEDILEFIKEGEKEGYIIPSA